MQFEAMSENVSDAAGKLFRLVLLHSYILI